MKVKKIDSQKILRRTSMGLDFGKKEPAAVQPAVQNEIKRSRCMILSMTESR